MVRHQSFKTDAEDRLACAHEAFVAIDVGGTDALHFVAHGLRITAIVEGLAVIETNAIKWRNRPQIDIVGQAPSAYPPKLFEKKRSRHDGRTGVERETVLPVDVGAPTRRIELFNHCDP
jgi:hypothetical protein